MQDERDGAEQGETGGIEQCRMSETGPRSTGGNRDSAAQGRNKDSAAQDAGEDSSIFKNISEKSGDPEQFFKN
jgi:hypothetical protein